MSVLAWHNDTLGKKVVEALKKNSFDAVYFSNRQEAVDYVLKYVSPGAEVGLGGSMTIQELGLEEKMLAKGAHILNHNKSELSAEQKLEIRRRQLLSDVFLCSTNALTLDGVLVNIDGAGNRVAAMTFGPRKVIVVTGINKISEDVHAAFKRIKNNAAPKNNKRLNYPNPCVYTGTCMDCQGESRICRVYSILRRKPSASDITVVVIGENLGY